MLGDQCNNAAARYTPTPDDGVETSITKVKSHIKTEDSHVRLPTPESLGGTPQYAEAQAARKRKPLEDLNQGCQKRVRQDSDSKFYSTHEAKYSEGSNTSNGYASTFSNTMNLQRNSSPTQSSPNADKLACSEGLDPEMLILFNSNNKDFHQSPTPTGMSPRVQTPVNCSKNVPLYGSESPCNILARGSPVLNKGFLCHVEKMNPKADFDTQTKFETSCASWALYFVQRQKDIINETEFLYHRSHSYMSKHPEINAQMRWMVINWMQQVAYEHKLKRTTFHLAVNYFDIYLSKEAGIHSDTNFQLLGVMTLILASKMEEESAPPFETLAEFVASTDDPDYGELMTEAKLFINKSENKLFDMLEWNLSSPPSTHDFLLSYFQLIHFCEARILKLENSYPLPPDSGSDAYILRLSVRAFATASNSLAEAVSDYESVKFSNSVLASSIFYLTYEDVLSNTSLMKFITGYSINDISNAIDFMKRYKLDAYVDLMNEFPMFGIGTDNNYDVVHNQSQTSKTLEVKLCEWEKWHL